MLLCCPYVYLCIGFSFALTQWPVANENRLACSNSVECPTWFYCDEPSRKCLPCAVCLSDQYPIIGYCQPPAACATSHAREKNILKCPDLPEGTTVQACYNKNILGSWCNVSCLSDTNANPQSLFQISCLPTASNSEEAEWNISKSSLCANKATTITPETTTTPADSAALSPGNATKIPVDSPPHDILIHIALPAACATVLITAAAVIITVCLWRRRPSVEKSRSRSIFVIEQETSGQPDTDNSTSANHLNGMGRNSKHVPTAGPASSDNEFLLSYIDNSNIDRATERKAHEQEELSDSISLEGETDVKQIQVHTHSDSDEANTQIKTFMLET